MVTRFNDVKNVFGDKDVFRASKNNRELLLRYKDLLDQCPSQVQPYERVKPYLKRKDAEEAFNSPGFIAHARSRNRKRALASTRKSKVTSVTSPVVIVVRKKGSAKPHPIA